MKKSLSVIIPAFNEEKNISGAIQRVKKSLQTFHDYEIIVVNDGSTDTTRAVVAKLARTDKRIRVITHKTNLGVGAAIKNGIAASKKEYVTQFHGDNDTSEQSLRNLAAQIGKADIITAYTANPQARSFVRRFISKAFVTMMNLLFGLRLRYYTGFFICKTKLLRALPLQSNGFAFYPEAKVRLIKAGATYIEVPSYHTGRQHGATKAVSIASVLETVRTIGILLADIYIRRTPDHSPGKLNRIAPRVQKV